ncbi:MAG TPA: NUDIX hydrolase [Ktedonobacteraceae bacterium]|nr:NUDIX hydrolase [Ktedonobacteraceae bacterium]
MIRQFLYNAIKMWAAIFFNLLNFLLVGNLPPFGGVSVVVEEQGRYLVIQRPEGYFVFPGGFMRWREHPEKTALRECKEETGLQIQIISLIGCSSTLSSGPSSMSTLSIIFHATVVSGTLRSSIEGKPMWMDEAELHDKLFKKQSNIFENYLAKRTEQCAETEE